MPLNNVTLTGSLPGGAKAAAVFTPSNWLADPSDSQLIPPAPVQVQLSATGAFSVSLTATDNAHLPAGWYWTVAFSNIPATAAYSFSFFLAFANGATQDISGLASIPSPVPVTTYLPVPSGTPTAGFVPIATGSGEGSAWGNPPGGAPSGAAGGDLSGTYPNPGVAKSGGVAFGTAAFQATGAFDASGAAAAAQAASLQKSSNLSDVASASTSRTNLGLGTAATQASSAFLQPANNLSDVATPATALTNLGTLSLVAATAVGGYTLVNGTGTILTWTAPSDGKLHRVMIFATLSVGTTEVGGTLQSKIFAPDGNSVFTSVFAAAQAAGVHVNNVGAIAEAGQPVTVQQTSALTSGASTLWVEIWAL